MLRLKHWFVIPGATAILFAICMQLSIAPVYQMQRRAIRHEMKDRILAGSPMEALTVFRLTAAELEEVDFVDGGRELRQEGVMYDIVRVYGGADGRVVIEAARDDKETKLMAGLSRMVDRRLASDEEGRLVRSLITGTWAVYCEPWPNSAACTAFVDREIHHLRKCIAGRDGEAVDPGPPRTA